jgi:hypothetical protein
MPTLDALWRVPDVFHHRSFTQMSRAPAAATAGGCPSDAANMPTGDENEMMANKEQDWDRSRALIVYCPPTYSISAGYEVRLLYAAVLTRSTCFCGCGV